MIGFPRSRFAAAMCVAALAGGVGAMADGERSGDTVTAAGSPGATPDAAPGANRRGSGETNAGDASAPRRKGPAARASRRERSRRAPGAGGDDALGTAERRKTRSIRARRRRSTGGTRPQRARDPIVVGIAYHDSDSWDRYVNRFDARMDTRDAGPHATAMAAHINATGGIAGRSLQLRLRRYDLRGGQPHAVTFEEVCADFASPPRPIVVISAGDGQGRGLAQCLTRLGIPLIENFPTAATTDELRDLPDTLFATGSLALDRIAVPYVKTLHQTGFLRDGARVAVLRASRPSWDRVWEQHLRPALTAAGVEPVAQAAVPFSGSDDGEGAIVAAVASAIVRFRAARANRIVSLDYAGGVTGLFMLAAEPQGYRPQFALSSLNGPGLLQATAAPAQLRGAVGIGWSPLTDVAAAQDEGGNTIRDTCSSVYAGAGLPTGDRVAWGAFGAYGICDSLLLLRRALDDRPARNASDLRAAIEALGERHQSALTFQTLLGRDRHDGAAAYRVLRYDAGCSCMRYEGPLRRL